MNWLTVIIWTGLCVEKHIKLIIIRVTFEILLMDENPKYNVSSCPSTSNYSPGNQQHWHQSQAIANPLPIWTFWIIMCIFCILSRSPGDSQSSKPLFPSASQLGPQTMGKQRQAIPTVLAEFLTHDCDWEA